MEEVFEKCKISLPLPFSKHTQHNTYIRALIYASFNAYLLFFSHDIFFFL